MEIYFTLDDREPVATDREGWREFFHQDDGNRVVGDTSVGDIRVLTEFIGVNQTRLEAEPKTFRTTFYHLTGVGSIVVEMYTNWDDATIGHKAWAQDAKDAGLYSILESNYYNLPSDDQDI